MFKIFIRFFSAVLTLLFVTSLTLTHAQTNANNKMKIKLGVTGGPHEEIAEVVKQVAAKEGLEIKLVSFSDFTLPNAALSAGDLDANSFQHQPYLDQQVKDKKYQIVSIAKNFIFPIGIYSNRIKHLNELKEKSTIAIPNDPTNGGRALLLLQREKIITLKPNTGFTPMPFDIQYNPKKIKFIEVDAARITKMLSDVDAAAINTDYAVLSNMNPEKDALVREAFDNPYANVIAVNKKDVEAPWVKKLIQAYQSQAVKDFLEKKYKGQLIPAF